MKKILKGINRPLTKKEIKELTGIIEEKGLKKNVAKKVKKMKGSTRVVTNILDMIKKPPQGRVN